MKSDFSIDPEDHAWLTNAYIAASFDQRGLDTILEHIGTGLTNPQCAIENGFNISQFGVQQISESQAYKDDPAIRGFYAAAENSNPDSNWKGHESILNYT